MSVFVAQLIPLDEVKNVEGTSQAGINFCFNFIKAISPEIVYAYQIGSEKRKLTFDFENDKIRYIAFRFFPHFGLLKLINIFVENILIIKSIVVKKNDNIWFYNMTPPVFFIFIVLKFLFKKKCFVLVADFTPELIRYRFALKLLQNSSGIISLTTELRDFLGNENKIKVIVKPGIVSDNLGVFLDKGFNNRFLFSGSLSPYTGIELALKVFATLPDFQLFISGRGQCEEMIKEYTLKCSNIHFLGFLTFNEYVSFLKKCNFVLSLRDTSLGKNLYNFPSKIVEYFVAKKIVISTKKYVTLPDNTYIVCDYTEASLRDAIIKTTSLSPSELDSIRLKAHQFALTNFSYESWHESVVQLESIN